MELLPNATMKTIVAFLLALTIALVLPNPIWAGAGAAAGGSGSGTVPEAATSSNHVAVFLKADMKVIEKGSERANIENAQLGPIL